MASCCSSPFHTLLSYPGTARQRRCVCPPEPGGSSSRSFLFSSAAQFDADGSGGFWTCTESLGFESSDERVMDERDETEEKKRSDDGAEKGGKPVMRKTEDKKRAGKNFPPALPGFELNGRTRSFMKAERTGGRLRLTEVRVERQEILRAYRDGGRLRLQMVVGQPTPLEDAEDGEEHEEAVEEEMAGKWRHGFQRCLEEEGCAAAIFLRGAHVA